MKVSTSLYCWFIITILSLFQNRLNAQSLCDPDQIPPVFTYCPPNITIDINDTTTCQPTVYWAPPEVSDTCQEVTTGFTGFLDFASWARDSFGPGTPEFAGFSPDSIRVRGQAGGPSGASAWAELCVTFSCSGTVSFDWLARKSGASFSFAGDHAFYLINGTPVQLTPNSGTNASGSLSLSIAVGDELCFRVNSNNLGTQTYLTISNIEFDNLQLTQISGPQPDSAPGAGDGEPFDTGTHIIIYRVMDCGGNVNFCTFTVTMNDAPPTITCPPSVVINLDTFDCNRVLCYNVEATDNCTNSNQVIPGFQFLGVYNGNTYYISASGAANRETWLDANLIAAQLGGHLVTIGDAGENTFLANNIPFNINPLDNQYWIGLRYIPIDAAFNWITCEPFVYSNWGIGQPGFFDGDFVYYWELLAGTWFDDPSIFSRRFIVEFEGGLQIQMTSAGVPPGSPFPPGVTVVDYQVTDAVGQTATCSFSVNVIGSSSLVCKNINVSLNENCEALITPQMLLAGEYNCYDVFDVTLSHYGIPVPNPIDSAYLGLHIVGTVTDPTTGNSCWSDILIEDKLAPVLVCRADTTDCYLFNFDFPLNYSGQDCSEYTVTTLDERIEVFNCDTNFLKAVYREILITDAGGNTDQCTDTIFVRRIQQDEISLPDNQIDLLCDSIILLDENGHPSPLVTGLPSVVLSNGTTLDIWPLNILLDCHLFIQYEDIDLGEINCVRKIMRSWTVREWWCGTEITRTVVQLIIIRDIFGPVITHAPYGFAATTGRRDCEARVLLPEIEAHDICHDPIRVDIAYPGGILINQNGGYVDLPIGEDTVYYRLYDACYNLTEYYIIISVTDDTEPVAVCDRNTVVALNQSGFNWVPAEVFDDGSFDECSLHHFEVRRMDLDHCGTIGEDDWGPEVGFCCEDVGRIIMVAFKAIDVSGNEAICMVNVEVQDKVQPVVHCPPNITIDCRFDIDYNNLSVFGVIAPDASSRDTIIIDPVYHPVIDFPPLDGFVEDNCPPSILEDFDLSLLNQCGIGLLYRIFRAVDQQGNLSTQCFQIITVVNNDTFDINDITWPLDLDTAGICDHNVLIPELLSQPYSTPVVNDDECSLIGMSYHDAVFTATLPGDPCFKIIRVWEVIDWCQTDIFGNITIWRDTQILKVRNEVDPVILRVTQDTTICTYDVACAPIPVTFSIEANDDCTDSTLMLYTYKIDFDGDGTIDVFHSAIGGNIAQGTWPIGRHIVKWEVEDRCGNTAKAEFILDIQSCKSPVAYCLNGLSTNLTPMDTDSNGIADTAMDTVWAKDFDAGSYHNCGYPIWISFSADINDTFRIYNCDSIRFGTTKVVEMWVTDINGNTSFCRTFIDVQDNLGFCPPNLTNSNVQGTIKREDDEGVQSVNIELANSGFADVKTDFYGKYSFIQIPNGQSVIVKPSKTDAWVNGVSTADIIKIQRHILGIEGLDSPYKMIAADVNKSLSITAKDISDLRKLILGIISEVNGNTSWRFVHELHSFNTTDAAWNKPFPETYEINSLNGNMNLDFIAMKMGDVNLSALTKGLNSQVVRNKNVLELQMDEQKLAADETTELLIRVPNGEKYGGMQFTLQWDIHQLDVISVSGNEDISIRDEHFSLLRKHEGKLTFSWNGEMKKDDWILKLIVKAKQASNVSQAFAISSAVTPSLSVLNNGEEGHVAMSYRNSSPDELIVLQNEPNPWNHQTTIGMLLPRSGEVSITVYDVTGKIFLHEKMQYNKGYNEYILAKEKLDHSGVYYYQVDFEMNTVSRKMLITD